jgi:hypothetical protein
VVKVRLPLLRKTLRLARAVALPTSAHADGADGELFTASERRRRLAARLMVLVLVVVVAWWALRKSEWLNPPPVAMKLASSLVASPSNGRARFAYWMRDLRDLAEEASAALTARPDPDPVAVAEFMKRLDKLVVGSSDFERELSVEERKVFKTVKQGIGQLRAFLRSFKEQTPDLAGLNSKAASAQFDEALHLIAPDLGRRGESNGQFHLPRSGAAAKPPQPVVP